MQCIGKVLENKGDVARVLIESGQCDHCHACGFGAVREQKSMEVNALNRVGAKAQEKVYLQVSGRKVMGASAILFLIPFGGLVVGFLIGYYPLWYIFGTARTGISLITAFALLAASYFLVYVLSAKSEFEFEIQGLAGEEPGASNPFARS
jgi:positive regulator of sigma E activity